jgi:hypothetical protein
MTRSHLPRLLVHGFIHGKLCTSLDQGKNQLHYIISKKTRGMLRYLYWPNRFLDRATEYYDFIARMEKVTQEITTTVECDGASLQIDNNFMEHFGVLDDRAAELVLTGLEKVPIYDVDLITDLSLQMEMQPTALSDFVNFARRWSQ